MKNSEVVNAWIHGQAGKNSKKNLLSNGKSLYSYRMLIGITLDNGDKCLLNLLGCSAQPLNTTKRHSRSYSYRNIAALKFVTPAYNPRGYRYNTYLFPDEILARAIGTESDKRALDYTEAIITMY